MSIIDNFKANGLSYTTSGSPSNGGHGCDAAFDKTDKFFRSTSNPPYWQISFEQIVTIGSYTLKTLSLQSWCMTVWKISYSLDGSSFVDLQNDYLLNNLYDPDKNIPKYPLKNLIRCKIFKITVVKSSDNTDDMIFNAFDCFSKGSLSKIENKGKCSCNFYFYKRRLTISFLLTLFPSFLTQ